MLIQHVLFTRCFNPGHKRDPENSPQKLNDTVSKSVNWRISWNDKNCQQRWIEQLGYSSCQIKSSAFVWQKLQGKLSYLDLNSWKKFFESLPGTVEVASLAISTSQTLRHTSLMRLLYVKFNGSVFSKWQTYGWILLFCSANCIDNKERT